jgi:hypothetical protein
MATRIVLLGSRRSSTKFGPNASCTQLDESCGGGDARELTISDAEIRRHTRRDQSASGSSASGPCTALDTVLA